MEDPFESDKRIAGWSLALLGILAVSSLLRLKSKTPIQQTAKPLQAQDSTRRNSDVAKDVAKNERQPATGIIAEAELPPAKGKDDKTANRRRRIANLRKAGVFWLEIGTFVALIAYATITKNQWKESMKASTAATRAADTASITLEAQNRSWLDTNFEQGPQPTPFADKGFLVEPFRYMDVGRGPAVEIEGSVKAVLANRDEIPDFTNYHCGAGFKVGGILSPSAVSTKIPVDVCGPGNGPNGWIRLASTTQTLAEFEMGHTYIARYGKITYRDLLPPKKMHWIQFCSIRGAPFRFVPMNVLKACLDFNKVDED